jgi:EmrB/QacA subfamily drug resistance transporter
LPSIEGDLGFAQENLQWVLTAYALTFGGFLLLGGRAADLLGRRLIFMAGLALFTVASLACGLSQSDEMLIGARAVQGLGAAIVSPAALSIISVTFTEGAERNKALGAWGAVGGSGAAAGVLLGGILTKYLGWEWIFFVNIPVGIVVLALAVRFVRESRQEDAVHEYDVLGALSVTGGLVLLVYAISEAPDVGWATFRTIGLLVLSGALLLFFVWWESRERAPLMPLGIFRNRMLTAANVVSLLQSGGIFGSFLLLTLYMQQVLGLSVLQTGVGFLATAGTAVLMAAPAQALVTRFGPKLVTVIGLSLLTAGALWYTQIDVDGSYPVDLLPGFLMVGIGIPFSYIPITIAALAGVADRDSGLAAGLLNTSQQVGGAIGVAVISTVSFTHFETLVATGSRPEIALTEGFQWGFWLTAGIWAASLLAAILLIRRMEIPETEEAAAPTAV